MKLNEAIHRILWKHFIIKKDLAGSVYLCVPRFHEDKFAAIVFPRGSTKHFVVTNLTDKELRMLLEEDDLWKAYDKVIHLRSAVGTTLPRTFNSN